MKSSRGAHVVLALVVLMAGLLAGGCSTAEQNRWNLTPELQTMSRTSDQRKNNYARTVDTNFRQINDDWDSILLLEKPSSLSQYPIP